MAPVLRARREFHRSGIYVPREMPSATLEWPQLRPRPAEPSKQSLLTYLPMLLFPIGFPLITLLFSKNPSMETVLPSLIMGVMMAGFYLLIPWWQTKKARKQYQAALEERKAAFEQDLERLEAKAKKLARLQSEIFNDRYPPVKTVLRIGLEPKMQRRRLWTRERGADDFLTLRIGTGPGEAAFSFANPPSFQYEDKEFEALVKQLQKRWQQVPELPITLSLVEVGSVVFRGRREYLDHLLNRVIIDLAIHHSPRLVRVGLIAQQRSKAIKRWEWLKWLPHTRVLEEFDPPFLAFTPDDAARLLDHIGRRLEALEERERKHSSSALQAENFQETIVLFFDEEGAWRRSELVARLVERGKEINVFSIFIGDPAVPGVRAEVRLHGAHELIYKAELLPEEGTQERKTLRRRGEGEFLDAAKAEEIARTLLALEPPEPIATVSLLPEQVSLAELMARVYQDIQEFLTGHSSGPASQWTEGAPLFLDKSKPAEILSEEIVQDLWHKFGLLYGRSASENNSVLSSVLLRRFLHFPIGLTLHRGKILPAYLNVLPEGSKWEGKAAYHTILIGPTGSGKSEFLKSLIWGAAFQYPPLMFNVFFMDFKGGAAVEDLKHRYETAQGWEEENLPHLVGLVTNPGMTDPSISGRAISRRGIYSLQMEIERRENLIVRQGKSKDIWQYNTKVLAARRGEQNGVDPTLPLLPHLLIILDEFSKALDDFPELVDILDDLVRRGRAWGMYLLLANQNVTPAVTKLLANVGWRIALRMQGEGLREVIRPGLADLSQVGRGYLLCVPDGNVLLFQSAYGGVSLYEDEENISYDIYEIEAEGRSAQPIYQYRPAALIKEKATSETDVKLRWTQGRFLTQVICQTSKKLQMPAPRKVYLEPLPPQISLEQLLLSSSKPLAYQNGNWHSVTASPFEALIGLMDNLEEVKYEICAINFDQGVGHLWILGVADSGKENVIEALLLSLAHRYTPEQVWMYILDFGASPLQRLENLPHVGGYVPVTDRERYRRLFELLQSEYEKRKNSLEQAKEPRLILVLHHFSQRDFAEMGDDEYLTLIRRLIKDGGKLGIHLIISSIQPSALREEEASSLGTRFILDLGKTENFWDAGIPRTSFIELTRRVPGRGYWLAGKGQIPRETQAATMPHAEARIRDMDRTWEGKRPPALPALPLCISMQTWLQMLEQEKSAFDMPFTFPAGLDFNLQPQMVDIAETSSWLVVGPVTSGKTNTLLVWGYTALRKQVPWSVWYFAQKQPKTLPQEAFREAHLFIGPDNIPRGWETLSTFVQSNTESPVLILVDDADDLLPTCQEAWTTPITEAIRSGKAKWMAALRNPAQVATKLYGSPFQDLLKRAQEERSGFLLSRDGDILSIYGIGLRSIPTTWKEIWSPKHKGRALFVFRDHRMLVQIPYLNACTENE